MSGGGHPAHARIAPRCRVGPRALALALALAALVSPAPAGAEPVLGAAEAGELAQQLADATEEHDICYGWSVEVDDRGGSSSGTDIGSSLGPGVDVRDERCPRWVRFVAFLTYESEWSDAEDSADWSVETNIEGTGDWTKDLSRLGVSWQGLLGERDDLVLANAVLALPALAVERGLADELELETDPAAVPAQDRPTGRPGSDFWRQNGAGVVLTTLMALGGTLWGAIAWQTHYRRQQHRRRQHDERRRDRQRGRPRPPAGGGRPGRSGGRASRGGRNDEGRARGRDQGSDD